MSEALSWYIAGASIAFIVGIVALLLWTMRIKVPVADGEKMGHSWDGIVELNNSLPRWWLHMFWMTIVFAIIYLVLYPGLGNYKGVFKWTSANQWQAEVDAAEADYGPRMKELSQGSIPDIAANAEAHKTGQRLFLTYCATCHGSGARGAVNYPNLTDKNWLWGGEPANILASISDGRVGTMPPMIATLGATDADQQQALKELTAYVMSLSGRDVDAALAAKGQAYFASCMGCHGADGKGNTALGAPNLTDDIWLHSRLTDRAVEQNIHDRVTSGVVNSTMPHFKDFLGEDRVKLLAAYVYGLSNK